ncbi:CPSF A subunit region-domain-containing protein [Fennellomyces sp. T-0311]|nr:CPSF A subunit region-domain-containing protein [Fennellomyces sp. T-0311]
MSEFNYVSTAQPPTAIHCTAKGNFLNAREECLIVSKSTRIEIYTIGNNSLTLVLEFGVFGRVESLAVCNASSRERCSLFILTDQDQYCVLSYDPSTSSIVTDSSGKLEADITRPVEDPIVTTAGVNKEMVIASVYGGLLHVFPIQPPKSSKGKGKATGVSNQPFSLRIAESRILSMVVLDDTERPTIVILYVDEKEVRRIKTYEINMRGRNLYERRTDGLFTEIGIDSSDHSLAAVPAPYGGVLVIGELMISYYDVRGTSKSTSINSMTPTAHAFIGNPTECLLGDTFGNLHLLTLTTSSSNNVTGVSVGRLGKASVASSITYLGKHMVFIGSTLGDSVMIRLRESDENAASLSIVDEMPSLSPIVDFCIYDLDRRGRQTMVCCSGGPNNGSLRIVREGVGFVEQASLPIPGVKKIWSLSTSASDTNNLSTVETTQSHDLLVIATVHDTRVLYIPLGEKILEEMEQFSGICMNETTLATGPIFDGKLIQVTPSSARLIKCDITGGLLSEWQPSSSEVITVAAVNGSQCALSYGSGTVVYLEVNGNKLVQKSSLTFSAEISCLDMSPLHEGLSNTRAEFLAVGLWGGENIQLVNLANFRPASKEVLPDKLVPRSLLLVNMEGVHYLMVALGDGQMVSYTINLGLLGNRQEITLGTHAASLHVTVQNGKKHVFASSDNPTMISSKHKRLMFSAVTLNDIRWCTSFDSIIMRQSIILSTGDRLMFGHIDPMRKFHVTKIPLDNQMGQRLTYHQQSKTIAVGTARTIRNPDNGTEHSKGWLRIFDARTFQVLDNYELLEQELVESIITAYIDDLEREFVFVGTAITHDEEETQLTGRVLAFQVKANGEYKLIDAFKVPGVVYSIKPFMGSIVASVEGSLFYMDKLKLDDEPGSRLRLDMKIHANVEALSIDTRGEFILVGDMIRSMSLIKLQDPSTMSLQKIAADYSPCWMTCVKILQDNIFLGAETYYNLFTAKRDLDIISEDESMHLEISGEFHLGDQVNCFREGSLAQWATDTRKSNQAPVVTTMYATANGAIGVIRSLTLDEYKLLAMVQTNILSVVKSIGDFDHGSWRMFRNSTKASEMRQFIDGDLVENYLKLTGREKLQVVEGGDGGERIPLTVEELDVLISKLHRGG